MRMICYMSIEKQVNILFVSQWLTVTDLWFGVFIFVVWGLFFHICLHWDSALAGITGRVPSAENLEILIPSVQLEEVRI